MEICAASIFKMDELFPMKIKAAGSSKIGAPTYQITKHHTPEDCRGKLSLCIL